MAQHKVIDYDKLYELAKVGLTEEQIAASLGISISTVTRRKRDDAQFEQALRSGRQSGISEVTNALFDSATGDKRSVPAQIFFLRSRAGWRPESEVIFPEKVTVEHSIVEAMQTLKNAGIDPGSL